MQKEEADLFFHASQFTLKNAQMNNNCNEDDMRHLLESHDSLIVSEDRDRFVGNENHEEEEDTSPV